MHICRSCGCACTPPGMDTPAGANFCGTPATQTVNLTGIAGTFTPLVVTATSSNTAMVPNPTVTYTSPNATGSLAYTPVAGHFGSATITVKVAASAACGGVTSVTRGFTVSITQAFGPPTVSSISNQSWAHSSGAHNVTVSGIGAGTGALTPISVFASSGNPSLVANPTVTYTSPNATATLGFSITTGSTGTAVITVTVDNSGPSNPPCQINNVSTTFTVTIT